MLARRLRRRSNNNPALGQCIVFAGTRRMGRSHHLALSYTVSNGYSYEKMYEKMYTAYNLICIYTAFDILKYITIILSLYINYLYIHCPVFNYFDIIELYQARP